MEESDWHQCKQQPQRQLVLRLTGSNHPIFLTFNANVNISHIYGSICGYQFEMKAQRDGSVAGACEVDMVKLPQTHKGN